MIRLKQPGVFVLVPLVEVAGGVMEWFYAEARAARTQGDLVLPEPWDRFVQTRAYGVFEVSPKPDQVVLVDLIDLEGQLLTLPFCGCWQWVKECKVERVQMVATRFIADRARQSGRVIDSERAVRDE